MNNYIEIENCRCCGNKIIEILDLNDQPLANSYHKIGEILDKYPLKLNLCTSCYHTQLGIVVNPSLMFKNYLYVSGTSNTLRVYFDFFANFTKNRFEESFFKSPKSILDIACNDGTQLSYYKKLGLDTYGIDPAENLYSLSKEHNVICDFFPSDKLTGKYDIITAQNVFAHTHDVLNFLLSCKELLSNEGLLYIQTSQSNMFVNNEFDTIYHEHLSFFNTNSMNTIVNRCGLVLNNVYTFDIHGTSYIFEISLNKLNSSNLEEFLNKEKEIGLYNKETYEIFSEKSQFVVENLKNTINDLRKENYHIIGYGAAAKGMTLLNFGDIKLDIIIDDNELKHNLYTPGTDILIKSIEEISNIQGDIAFIPLAWNFYTEIYSKIKNIRNNSKDIFIKYFPEIKINN